MLDQFLPFEPNLQSLLLLPVLILLEAVLSADNAVALAVLSRGLEQPDLQRKALNLGLLMAYGLRMALILTAAWVTQFWQVELAGAGYLLWLAAQYFWSEERETGALHSHHHRFSTLWEAVPLIALTDLAFSLDSVTTALAISTEIWVVVLGATIGIVILRLMSEWFVRWLKEFSHLEDAGYGAVALVGIRLLLRVFNWEAVLPDWLMVSLIGLLFAWGFSERSQPPEMSPEMSLEMSPETPSEKPPEKSSGAAVLPPDAQKQEQRVGSPD